MERDIYHNKRKLAAAEARIGKAAIGDKNKGLILDFKKHLVLRDISTGRIVKYVNTLKQIAVNMKMDFDAATKKDIERIVAEIQQNESFSEWTKRDYKQIIKTFYQWLRNSGDDFPDEVRWIKTRIKKHRQKLPEELLTEEDVHKMIEVAQNARDKALVAILFDSGCRIGEIGLLKIKDVNYDEYGAVLSVKGKTGARNVRIINSACYLSSWLNLHPNKDDKEAFVWVNVSNNHRGELTSYTRIRCQLKVLAKKAGIKKKVNPHQFRHSRATEVANFLTEFQMNQHFGWVQGSGMPATYVHLSGKNTDDALLKMNGLAVKKHEKEPESRTKTCPRCKALNSPDFKLCHKCGALMDLKTAVELQESVKERSRMDEALDILTKNPDFLTLLASRMKEMGIKV
jgi:site-specific recombinase XerD/ribosomal protein L40E